MTDLVLRLATPDDVPALSRLINESVRGLNAGHYSDAQVESALRFVFGVDSQLIADGSYYLIESASGPVAAGGWSARATLYGGDQHKSSPDVRLDPATESGRIRAFFVHPEWARRGLARRLFEACLDAARTAGFRSLELGATLPGVPLYAALGFTAHERMDASMPDGSVLPVIRMSRSVDNAGPTARRG